MKAALLAKLAGTLLAAGCLVLVRDGIPAAPVDWSGAQRVEIRLIEYQIVPDQLRFARALPYQLHIINAGKEGHDFTAPDFFASVELRDAGMLDERRSSLFLHPQEASTSTLLRPARDYSLRAAPTTTGRGWLPRLSSTERRQTFRAGTSPQRSLLDRSPFPIPGTQA